MHLYTTALAIGFFGSLHCLGMCGPIAMLCPSFSAGRSGRFFSALVYNGGRILSYSALGSLGGLAGQTLFLFKWQQAFSVATGAIIVAGALLSLKPQHFFYSSFAGRTFSNLQRTMSSLLGKRTAFSVLSIGLINGFLPCGMVLLALAGSLGTSTPGEGALYMILFGAGTTPMMAGLHLTSFSLTPSIRKRILKLIPVFAVMLGLVFIIRGFGLGIPFVSPSSTNTGNDIHCAPVAVVR